MTDFQSGRFLVSKKIAQLVKLVNHLSGELADLNFRRRFLHSQYESKLCNLTKECLESHTKQAVSCEMALQASTENIKPFFDERYAKLLSNFEAEQVDFSAQLSEFQVIMQLEISKIQNLIETITKSLDENESQIDELAELVMIKCQEHVTKLNNEHKAHLRAVNNEADERLDNLERQTGRKLDALDRDFNKSLGDLKAKFTSCSERSSSSQASMEQLAKMADNVRDLSLIMQNSRQELDFFVSTSKSVLKELAKKKLSLCKLLKSHSASFEKDKLAVQSETEPSFISLENQIRCLCEARDIKTSEYAGEITRIKEQLEMIRASNKLDSEHQRADLAKAVRDCKKDREDLILAHRKEKEELATRQNDEVSEITGRITVLEREILEQAGSDPQLSAQLVQIREDHVKEIAEMKENNEVQVRNLKRDMCEEYQDVRSITKEQIENLPTRKLLEENEEIYRRLLEEQAKCRIAITNDDGDEYNLLLEQFNAEKDALEKRQARDIEQIEADEKLILEAAMESRAEEKAELASRLQNEYESKIRNINNHFQDFEVQKCEIDKEYQQKMDDLLEELNRIQNPNFSVEIEEISGEELENLRRDINDKRKSLVDDWVSKQKEEENRHLRTISAIAYYNREDETDAIAQEYRLRIQKLSIRITELEQLLEEYKSYKLKANVATVNRVFDKEQSDLERELAELQARAKEEITSAESSADAAKKRVSGQILDLTNKMDRVEKVSKRHAVESKQGVLDAYDDTRKKLRKLHVNKEKNIAKISNDHQSCLDDLTASHRANFNSWKQRVETQISSNHTQEQSLAAELQRIISEHEHNIEVLESDHQNQLKLLHDSLHKGLADIDLQLNLSDKACNDIRDKYERNEIRDEERIIIDRLENQLSLKTKHVVELSRDLSSYKKQIISQEANYNSKFGTTPNVAVLRPQTACSNTGIRGRRCSRPVTASITGMRPVSILQSRRNLDPIRN